MATGVVRKKDRSPSLVSHLAGHKGTILCVKYHPTTNHVFTSGEDGIIMKWDLDMTNAKNRAMRLEDKEPSPVNDLSISKSGELVVSAHRDSSVKVWVPHITGKMMQMKVHTGQVFSASFNPTNQSYFATAGADKSVKVWSVNCAKTKANDILFKSYDFELSLNEHTNWVRSVRYQADGFLICSASDDKSIRLHDTRMPKVVETLLCPFGTPTFADFNPCSSVFIGASLNDSGFLMFDTRKLDVIQVYKRLTPNYSSNNAFAFHPSGDFAVCAFQNATVKILDLVEGRPSYTVYGSKKAVMAVDFNPMGHFFAIGGEDKQLLVWEAKLLPRDDQNEETEPGGFSEEIMTSKSSISPSETPNSMDIVTSIESQARGESEILETDLTDQ